jgi:hypothetical protein
VTFVTVVTFVRFFVLSLSSKSINNAPPRTREGSDSERGLGAVALEAEAGAMHHAISFGAFYDAIDYNRFCAQKSDHTQ